MPKNITKIAVCNSGVGIFSFLANFNFFHHNLCFQNAIFRSGVFARGIMGGGGGGGEAFTIHLFSSLFVIVALIAEIYNVL